MKSLSKTESLIFVLLYVFFVSRSNLLDFNLFVYHLDSKTKETEVLLLLYEFEALVKLRDPRVETLMEKALSIPGLDPKTFETMAGK